MTEESNEPKVRLNETALRLMKEGAPSDFPTVRIGEERLKRTHRSWALRGSERPRD